MTRKPARKPDDPEQFKRFLETAKERQVDPNPEAFERVFKKVANLKRKSAPQVK